MKIDRLEVREVAMPLRFRFQTSFGVEQDRRILLVRLMGDGEAGLAECVAGEFPGYSYETTDTAWLMLDQFIAPNVVGRSFDSATELLEVLEPIRGHNMAVAAVEMAYWDLKARLEGMPLWQALGGTLRPIPVGISIGIQESVEATVAAAAAGVAEGYKRVKLKIQPGWDVLPVAAVRDAFPEIALTVDANSAYELADAPVLQQLDAFGLDYIEQPLAHDDLVDHATLQTQLATPICLDESVHSPADTRKALQLGSGRVINLKVGRVRGFERARGVHDIAHQAGIPVWCGGMLESGVGRAANLHLSTLPGFTLPGDTSSGSRYWNQDVIQQPLEAVNGMQTVPSDGPGLGITLDEAFIASITTRAETY